ncbi:MAG TPA: type II toxin-antitoxin system VapC family toxin [Trebonia sp.]|nr:type II toxin-antitoxin system VapC family toxin [Trebonia sp.]
MIVTDASILVMALGDDGAGGAQARERLRGEELAAPHLVDAEVTSVLRRSVLAGGITSQRGSQALKDLADLDIERVAHTTLLPRVWELRENFTAYDACYVALAELFRAPLLTYDAKMAAAPGSRCEFEVLSVA